MTELTSKLLPILHSLRLCPQGSESPYFPVPCLAHSLMSMQWSRSIINIRRAVLVLVVIKLVEEKTRSKMFTKGYTLITSLYSPDFSSDQPLGWSSSYLTSMSPSFPWCFVIAVSLEWEEILEDWPPQWAHGKILSSILIPFDQIPADFLAYPSLMACRALCFILCLSSKGAGYFLMFFWLY
jgi:hypothetical protein